MLSSTLLVLGILAAGVAAAPFQPVGQLLFRAQRQEAKAAAIASSTAQPGLYFQHVEGGPNCTLGFMALGLPTEGSTQERLTGYYITAASCFTSADPKLPRDGCKTKSVPEGTNVTVAGVGSAFTLAYSSYVRMQARGETDRNACLGNDLALVEIPLGAGVTPSARLPDSLGGRYDPRGLFNSTEEYPGGIFNLLSIDSDGERVAIRTVPDGPEEYDGEWDQTAPFYYGGFSLGLVGHYPAVVESSHGGPVVYNQYAAGVVSATGPYLDEKSPDDAITYANVTMLGQGLAYATQHWPNEFGQFMLPAGWL